MQGRVKLAGIVAALLLVGGGCAANQSANVNVSADMKVDTGKEKENAIKIEGEVTPDTAAADILTSFGEEKEVDDEVSDDASEVDADKSWLDAYGSASYDVK